MEKDPTLLNIYLKIHNKHTLFLDDLRYLAQYAPECFEKTCQNVIYNMPEAKPIMDPQTQSVSTVTTSLPESEVSPPVVPTPNYNTLRLPTTPSTNNEFRSSNVEEANTIDTILDNLKRLEADDFPVSNVDAEQVKNLLGNLYMELLFPHNDVDTSFPSDYLEKKSTFDRKA